MILIGKRVGDFLPSFYMKLEMQEGLGWSFFKRENLGCHKKQFTSFFLFCAVHFLGRRRKSRKGTTPALMSQQLPLSKKVWSHWLLGKTIGRVFLTERGQEIVECGSSVIKQEEYYSGSAGLHLFYGPCFSVVLSVVTIGNNISWLRPCLALFRLFLMNLWSTKG